jgi:hypothetical protein
MEINEIQLEILQVIKTGEESNRTDSGGDSYVAESLGFSLDKVRYHFEMLEKKGYVKLVKASNFGSKGEASIALLTSKGKMAVMEPDELDESTEPQSTIFNQHFYEKVGVLQNGNYNTANVTQNINQNITEILQLVDALRQSAVDFSPEQHKEAIEHLEDVETQVKSPEPRTSNLKGSLLALWLIAQNGVSYLNETGLPFLNKLIDLANKLNIPLPHFPK